MSNNDVPYRVMLLRIEVEVRTTFQLDPTILGDLLSELHCMARYSAYIDGVVGIFPADPEAAVRSWLQRRMEISRLFTKGDEERVDGESHGQQSE